MLYHLFVPLIKDYTFLNVFTYITFRAAGAAVTALLMAFIVGPIILRILRARAYHQVVREGSGPKPAATDTVKVHYVGTLLDGTKFDSSIDRGEPAQFALNAVIPGWTEALMLMKKGTKYRLWIPSELAYGPNGAGGVIPPNAVLDFDVTLVDVAPGAAAHMGGMGAPPQGM